MTGETVEVVLPQLGETVARGTVLRWLVEPGDRVEEDEHVCEISTDKIDTEIPSPAAGVVEEIVVPEGTTVEVGAVLARLAPEEAGTGAAEGTAAGEGEAAAAGGGAPESDEEEDEPLHFAESGIDLFGGEASASREAADGGRATEPAAEPDAEPRDEPGTGASGSQERVSAVRRVMAERTARSKREIPHCTTVVEADLDAVAALRERRGEAFEAATGVHLTYLPFLARATVLALERHPLLNATFEDGAVRPRDEIHLGLAVATDDGLLVPVLRRADRRGPGELARAADDLARRARSGDLEPDEVRGGTFTLTNHGRGGSILGTPIIVPPQTAILGVGRIREVPVARDGRVEVGTRCYLSLSFDHRAVDGAAADAFLADVTGRLADAAKVASWLEGAP